MSKKPLYSRLNTLFSDLEQEASGPLPPEEIPPTTLGWFWECDGDGRYTWCSPEVESCLGLTPESFNGKLLDVYAIQPEAGVRLRNLIQQNGHPVETEAPLRMNSGEWVNVRLQVMVKPGKNGHRSGWRGVCQLLSAEDSAAPLPATDEGASSNNGKNAYGPNGNGQKKEIASKEMRPSSDGLAFENGEIKAAKTLWSSAGKQSLETSKLVAQAGETGNPAAIAIPISVGEETKGILEILDESNEGRRWSEEERLLVEEVAGQLAIALENARLYEAVHQELAERTRAEQEVLRRNQDLAALNQIGQELSKLARDEDILDILFNTIGEIFDSRNLTIALYNEKTSSVAYPIHTRDGKPGALLDGPVKRSLVGHILKTKSPLLLGADVASTLHLLGIEPPNPAPASMLAVPMITGDRPLGAILLEDFQKENAYTNVQLELLSTIASQATTALENAKLFGEITTALTALETRERYQSHIASSVAILTEFGTRNLMEVLQALGRAAQASRVYFSRVVEDAGMLYWESTGAWIDPDANHTFDSEPIRRMPVNEYPYWSRILKEKGWVCDALDRLPPAERMFLMEQGIQSSLLLAVQGKRAVPGFVAFDQVDHPRKWQNDEISSLQVAADALSNTTVREDLLDQLQVSLDETENLYNASHRLALATELQEMVASIATSVNSTTINRCVLVLFDESGGAQKNRMKVAANWYAGFGTPPPAIGTNFAHPACERLFVSSSPAFYNVSEDNIDPTLAALLQEQDALSVAILPLWASKYQLGVLLLMSEELHPFTGREIRSFPPLIDQMATSIENLRLFKQTQEALSETALLYQISNGIAQATNSHDLIRLVGKTLLAGNADLTTILRVTQFMDDEPSELEIVGIYDARGEYDPSGLRLPVSDLPLVHQVGTEALILNDITTMLSDPVSRKTLLRLDVLAACIVPLRSAGRLVGLLVAASRRPATFKSDYVHLLQVASAGVAVAIERQRLLEEARRRALELQTAAEITRDTTSTLSLDKLLQRMVNLVKERFNFYHVSIFLNEEGSSNAVITESTGETGRILKERNFLVKAGSRSAIGQVLATGEPVVINDAGRSEIFTYLPMLSDTRSEISLPLKLGERILGVLDAQSTQVNSFTPGDVTVFQTLADQIAIAIDNARSYELVQKAVEDMREVDRMKSQFLANMSHELRTPLNSIIGFSRVILKGIDGPINDIQQQDLSAIYNSGQHLLNLINDVLDLSKIEAGKMELSFSEIDITEIVNSVMSTAIGLVKDKQVELKKIVPESLPKVRGDTTRIRQVLLNLISNAAKFTDDGSITIEVSIKSGNSGKLELFTEVTDTGPGIAAEDQHKLFQPFSQVDNSPTRKTGGTGLGLSICRSLMEMHGGDIGLNWSEVGKGSRFFFSLPLQNQPEPEEAPTGDSHTILVIDDDMQVIKLYQRYLNPQGYYIVPLTEPSKAVEKALEIHPLAITLDVMMPQKDGWTVLRELKNNPETRSIPIIMCSILEEEEKGFSLGASDYLVKPFLREDLVNSISRLDKEGQNQTVLVVDDDPDDLRLLKKLIDESGRFHAKLAEGGLKGWEMLQTERPDVVVLDMFMPDMDGFRILEKIRSDPDLKEIPVVVLTGVDLSAEQQQKLIDFRQQMLTKGFLSEKELMSTLDRALQKMK